MKSRFSALASSVPLSKGDFEIPTDVPDEDETPDEQDTEPI